MAKKWLNLGFVTIFLTKFVLFDEETMAIWWQNTLEPTNHQILHICFNKEY